MMTLLNTFLLAGILISSLLLGGCASSGDSEIPSNANERVPTSGSGRVAMCRATDTRVESSSQCLQDDAACYQTFDGGWCTGDRTAQCPAGSQALAAGATCPTGKRCFQYSESLECFIN